MSLNSTRSKIDERIKSQILEQLTSDLVGKISLKQQNVKVKLVMGGINSSTGSNIGDLIAL
jgi:hypothetical protein